MSDYQKMYNILFNSLTDISKIIEHTRRELENFYTPPDDRPVIMYIDGKKRVFKDWAEAESVLNPSTQEDLQE